MRKWLGFLFAFMAIGAQAQYTPPPAGAYNLTSGAWAPFAATGGAAANFTPPPAGLYCQLANGTWTPWTATNCGGGGGGGGGDTITSPNGTLTVGGTANATTLDVNLSNPNTVTGIQTFTANPVFNTAFAPIISAANMTNFPIFNQSTTGTASGLSGTQAANTFYGAPSGAAGVGSFRKIVWADGVALSPFLSETCTGDSITLGAYASSQAAGYCNTLGAALNTKVTNNGAGGRQTGDLAAVVYGYTIPASSANLYVMQLGTNDVAFWGAVANLEASFQLEQFAESAFTAIPAANKQTAQGGACTFPTGTWTNGTYYTGVEKMSSTAGAQFQCVVTGTVIYIGTNMVNSNAATASCTVDGSGSYSLPLTGVGGTPITTNVGIIYGPALTRISGLSNTSHTVLCTESGTGTVYFDWIAGLSGAAVTNYPILLYGDPPAQNPVDAVTPVYDTIVSNVAAQLVSDGLTNVNYVETYPVLAGFPQYYSNQLHPNDHGYYLLAQKYYNVLATAVPNLPPFPNFTGAAPLYNTAQAGPGNTAAGSAALSSLAGTTAGGSDTAFGFYAGSAVTTGSTDTFIGYWDGLNTTASSGNTGVGSQALAGSNTGGSNTAVGYAAATQVTTAAGVTAIGYQACENTTTGTACTALGQNALINNVSGTNDVGIGLDAGEYSTGNSNVFLGPYSGVTFTSSNATTSGIDNTFVGYASGPFTNTQLTNCVAIGYLSGCDASNEVELGNGGITALKQYGTLYSPQVSTSELLVTPLATPVNGTFSTATTGGTLAASTSYCYRIVAIDATPKTTLASTETCQTTGSGTATNTVTVTWGFVPRAQSYQVYGRTSGGELQMAAISGTLNTYTDTGSATPSGALPAANTSGNFTAQAVQIGGTKWAASGTCALTSSGGGASAGTFVLTTGGSGCTVISTFSGVTATNGWSCWANDLTHGGLSYIYETASNTTTATLQVAAAASSGDVFNYGCLAY